jgi:hypothetical protein
MSEPIPVGAYDPSKKNSQIEATNLTPADTRTNNCYWNGVAYAPGSVLCAGGGMPGGGRQYICTPSGGWKPGGIC